MKTYSRALCLFSLAGIANFVAAGAPAAEAYEAQHAISCFNSQDDWPGDYVGSEYGIRNQSGGLLGRPRPVYCPIPNTGTNVGDLWVTGLDNNNETYFDSNILVRACSTAWYGDFIDCSGSASASSSSTYTGFVAVGMGSIVPHFNVYSHRVMPVSIPRDGVYGNSRLIGYETF